MLQKKADIGYGSEKGRDQLLPTEACPYCGRQRECDRISLREMAISILCAILLIAIAIPLVCVTERWLDQQARKSSDNLVWRERIERW
jgi:hypothetical protein